MKKKQTIIENFLDDDHLIELDAIIGNPQFPWFLNKEQVVGTNDGCYHNHSVYDNNIPQSGLYYPISKIFKDYLRYISLCRITVNLQLKQESPSKSSFHTDFQQHNYITDETKITTAIFYLNTNNGATEFKDGDKIDCVRNRLLIFPTPTLHRVVGQTDTNQRIILNFNYIL